MIRVSPFSASVSIARPDLGGVAGFGGSREHLRIGGRAQDVSSSSFAPTRHRDSSRCAWREPMPRRVPPRRRRRGWRAPGRAPPARPPAPRTAPRSASSTRACDTKPRAFSSRARTSSSASASRQRSLRPEASCWLADGALHPGELALPSRRPRRSAGGGRREQCGREPRRCATARAPRQALTDSPSRTAIRSMRADELAGHLDARRRRHAPGGHHRLRRSARAARSRCRPRRPRPNRTARRQRSPPASAHESAGDRGASLSHQPRRAIRLQCRRTSLRPGTTRASASSCAPFDRSSCRAIPGERGSKPRR